MDKKNGHQEDFIRERQLLEGSLGGRFRETTWRRILDSGSVRDYLNGTEDWDDVRSFAQEQLTYQRELEREMLGPQEQTDNVGSDDAGDVAKPERTFVIKLPEREKKRADVLLKIWMRKAAARPDVKRFRSERLGDQRLYFDDAEAFFSSGLLQEQEEITDWELADLARRLERDYGWRQDDAAWFVLTNRPPRLRPLAADVSMSESPLYGLSHCKITLHVVPWVPSEVVERAFVQVRDQVRGASGPGTVGEQRLEVLRFVEEQRAKHGRRPKFEDLLQIWNQEHPHWVYADYRALAKAYRQAYREVVYPKYRILP
jgi:hypothetical protein